MINDFRKALTAAGGLQVLLAITAIGWGIARLQQVVDARQELIVEQSEAIAQQEAVLCELAKQRHPAGTRREDIDPLGRAEAPE